MFAMHVCNEKKKSYPKTSATFKKVIDVRNRFSRSVEIDCGEKFLSCRGGIFHFA